MTPPGYQHIDVQEIVKESDTAFLVLYPDGEQEWIRKEQVASPTRYSQGDKDVVLHLLDG